MSRPMQRFLAALSMAVALLLAIPVPSHAAVRIHASGLTERAWSWLNGLLGHPVLAARPPAVRQKDAILVTPPTQPTPPVSQGPGIDPDGRK